MKPQPKYDIAAIAPEETLYVVGDIHGRADLLDRMLDIITADIGDRQVATPLLVFVGDYVDRGDRSAEVLARLQSIASEAGPPAVFLMGNHEKMLLEFFDETTAKGPRWLRNGGLQTLASFGVGRITEYSHASELTKASAAFRDALGEEAEAWLRNLPHLYQSGNVVCAHAGLDPSADPDNQNVRSLIWGHPDFRRKPRADGLWVAHGHYPDDEPGVEGGRIAVDTGAWFTERLTAAVIERGSVRFLST